MPAPSKTGPHAPVRPPDAGRPSPALRGDAAPRGFVLGAAGLFVVLAAAVLWDIADMPPPLFGPIGSDALPRAVALIVVALSVLVAIEALVRPAPRPASDAARPAPGRTLIVLALTFVYALLIDWGEVDFGLLSTVYVAATIGVLARPRGPALAGVALLAAGLGFGCDALFTRVLFIDLP